MSITPPSRARCRKPFVAPVPSSRGASEPHPPDDGPRTRSFSPNAGAERREYNERRAAPDVDVESPRTRADAPLRSALARRGDLDRHRTVLRPPPGLDRPPAPRKPHDPARAAHRLLPRPPGRPHARVQRRRRAPRDAPRTPRSRRPRSRARGLRGIALVRPPDLPSHAVAHVRVRLEAVPPPAGGVVGGPHERAQPVRDRTGEPRRRRPLRLVSRDVALAGPCCRHGLGASPDGHWRA